MAVGPRKGSLGDDSDARKVPDEAPRLPAKLGSDEPAAAQQSHDGRQPVFYGNGHHRNDDHCVAAVRSFIV